MKNTLNMSYEVFDPEKEARVQYINERQRKNVAYSTPVQLWKVETEGDCEGRSVCDLGQHYGHFAEIAFFLANKALYRLQLTPVPDSKPRNDNEERPFYTPTRKAVNISFHVDSGTWDLKDAGRIAYFQRHIPQDAPIEVLASNYYSCVKLKLK